ncbi:MAG: HEAT repeat domain-containing protein, partial [Planctomycetales bacterium]|nr:HEAT repeat domain-containing protein [Planctomycetales bacterium]
RLQEMAVLGNRLRQGSLMAQADGAVVVNSLLESESDARSETKGRILGGGVSGISRTLGLVLTSEHHSVRKSSMVGKAINARFHTYDRGTKRGVATPKRDNFIELVVHQRYRNNLMRYARVVQAIPVNETPHELMDRLAELSVKLQQPHTAVSAAVDLEAIGPEALPTLRKGLSSPQPIVRFASAEALAYLNEEEAVAYLTESARNEPAFRWHAFAALSSMTDSEAHTGLAELLHEPSDETRYGAFDALKKFNPRDPLVRGELVGDAVSLHKVASQTEPLIHVRRTDRPEIVFFGNIGALQTPAAVFAGKQILVKSEDANRLKVTRFAVGDADHTEYCANDVYAMVRTIVMVGGSYTDVVAAIGDAKQKGILGSRVKFDALPVPGRDYQLEEEPEGDFDGLDDGEILDESDADIGELAPAA